ncbi:7-cyano-7-deazaguanine synthase QueC [Desulfotomaculum defluvii]
MNSLVLLSGGLDSAVNLAYAQTEGDVKLALTIDYGQRAAQREIEAAINLAKFYNIPHRVIQLPWLADITKTALVNEDKKLPEPETQNLDRLDLATQTAAAVWVPNRNGLFVNIAACFAETLNCDLVIAGFNREEAATFSDNTPEFSLAATKAMYYSTANKVKVLSYTGRLDKKEIVALGERLQLPWKLIWSCYQGTTQMCGKCESCLRMIRAFQHLNIDLPQNIFATYSGGE